MNIYLKFLGKANSFVAFFFSFCEVNLWCWMISSLFLLIFEWILFFILGNKMVQLLLRDLSIELAQKYDASLEWTQNNYTHLIQPALYGVLVSIFTMVIIYFDSDVPGVNPPTPFSPRKANQYVMMICNRFWHLNFQFFFVCFELIRENDFCFHFCLEFGMRNIGRRPIIWVFWCPLAAELSPSFCCIYNKPLRF